MMLWLALYVASRRGDAPPRDRGCDADWVCGPEDWVLSVVGILTILAMAAFAIFMCVSAPPDPPDGNDAW